MSSRTVVCAGHVNWDVTLYVDRLPSPDGESVITDQVQSGGGSASNTAVVFAGLGLQPVLLGSVGDDRYARLVRKELSDVGVDCTNLKRASDGETTVKYLVVDEEGRVMVLANEGANEAFASGDLPEETLAGASHLHLTSQRPRTAYELARDAVAADIPVSFDPGRRLGARDYGDVIRLADVVFLNEEEADTAREEGLLAENDSMTVIKRGEGGAEAHVDGRTITHPGFEVDPVDTAGAGDAFAAGFLATRLDDGSIERALEVGNACGALAVRSFGARTRLSASDVERYLDN